MYSGAFSAEPGSTVKAIAKGSFDDEYSDIASCTLPDKAKAEITPLSFGINRKGGAVEYEIFIESEENVSGNLYYVLYDKNDCLLEMKKQKVTLTREGSGEPYWAVQNGSFKISGGTAQNAYYYKIFFWSDKRNFAPLSIAAEGIL